MRSRTIKSGKPHNKTHVSSLSFHTPKFSRVLLFLKFSQYSHTYALWTSSPSFMSLSDWSDTDCNCPYSSHLILKLRFLILTKYLLIDLCQKILNLVDVLWSEQELIFIFRNSHQNIVKNINQRFNNFPQQRYCFLAMTNFAHAIWWRSKWHDKWSDSRK